MKAIILMGGLGVRLYPLTENIPKGFIEIGGKKIIEHILEKISKVKEINEVYIISNERFFSLFCEWKKGIEFSKKIEIINKNEEAEKKWPGSVGTMAFAIDYLTPRESVVIIGGDTLFGFNIEESIKFFEEKKTSILAGKEVKDKNLLASRFGVIEVDKDNRIIGFEDKPKIPKSNLGSLCYYMLKEEDLNLVEQCVKEGKTDHSGDLIEFIFARRALHCFSFESEWFDVTDHEILKASQEFYEKKI